MSLNSELRLPVWLKCLPFVLLTLAGLWLRTHRLADVPFALDYDQAKVIYWGDWALGETLLRVYSDDETGFETFSSYLFAAAEKFWGVPEHPALGARILALMLSVIDLILLGLLLWKRGPLRMWQGVALLATCPWAIFYARIIGPCVGVSSLLLFEVWVAALVPQALTHVLGLLYYSLFRIVWLADFALAVVRKEGRRLAGLAGALFLFGLIVFVVQGNLNGVFRGGYNLPLTADAVGLRLRAWVSLWFGAPTAEMAWPVAGFILDPVSIGLARLLSSGPALGLGLVPLFALALIALPKYVREFDGAERRILAIFGLIFVALMISPTYSHGLIILPLVPWLILRVLSPPADRNSRLSPLLGMAIAVACSTGLAQSYGLLQNLGTYARNDVIFPDRLRTLFEEQMAEDPPGVPRSYFSPETYYSARYLAHLETRAGRPIYAYPALRPEELLNMIGVYWREHQSQILYFDIEDRPLPWSQTEAAATARQFLQDAENRINQQFEVLERKDVYVGDKPVARRYLIRRY